MIFLGEEVVKLEQTHLHVLCVRVGHLMDLQDMVVLSIHEYRIVLRIAIEILGGIK